MELFLIYVIAGIASGLLLGMLGVGCGLIIVPLLAFLLPRLNVATSVVMQIAITTSLAVIVITTFTSIIAHHRNHNVLWPLFRQIVAGSIIGAICGGIFAHFLPGQALRIFFGVFAMSIALRMLFVIYKKKAITPAVEAPKIPARFNLFIIGAVIAMISAILGIGGGTFTVPFLSWCRIPMRNAIATSTACGFPISLFAALALIVTGFHQNNLPSGSTSYLYWPALIGIGAGSVIFAPIGAKLAHRISASVLKQIFAMALLLAGLKMLF